MTSKEVEEIQKVSLPNRTTRRKMAKRIHCNVFTKKYKNKKSLEYAWKEFLGEESYKQLKKLIKAGKKNSNTKNDELTIQKNILKLMEKQTKELNEVKPLPTYNGAGGGGSK